MQSLKDLIILVQFPGSEISPGLFQDFINTDIVNFVWKTDEGEAESIVLLIFVLWRFLNLQWIRGGGVGQKVLFRAS